MDKRIGAAIILIENQDEVDSLNHLISAHSELILGRQGLPLREKHISVISLIIEGSTDQLSSFTGKIGKLPGIQVKSVLTTFHEKD